MPGCNDCKFYKSGFGDFFDTSHIEVERTCSAGNTDQLLTWWEQNGKKFDDLTDLPCHEHHESTKSLIEMNRLMDDLIKVVDHTSKF